MSYFKAIMGFVLILGAYGESMLCASQDPQWERGRDALQKMTGCYLIDYSYVEAESLRPGYTLDSRVYDVNKDKSVKEWIFSEPISDTRVRLQHILFSTDLQGSFSEGSILKHQAEDWEYNAPFLYEFVGPSYWVPKDLKSTPGLWTRKITNLDDGLRYQCASSWRQDTAYPEWTCENYAPIPGRETRDMGRKDYNTLQRLTRLMVYGNSWLERQENTKVIDQAGVKTPLAKELGKNWYVRLPDSECRVAQEFVQSKQAFWTLQREAWDEVLTGAEPFTERNIPRQPPRFVQMWDIEAKFLSQNLDQPAVRNSAKDEIKALIEAYRSRSAN